ncbi:hypothetical protein IV102_36795 [bacterium]|nr:hypothetical protein [bacterium]
MPKPRQLPEVCPVSRLKGIKIYYDNDLYEFAMLQLKLYDARAVYEGTNSRSRSTVNGLVKNFAGLINACNPDYATVLAAINRLGLSLRASIEFDHEPPLGAPSN